MTVRRSRRQPDETRPAAGRDEADWAGRRWLLWTLAAAAFLVFFQAFMVAPLITRLAQIFGSSTAAVGVAVPRLSPLRAHDPALESIVGPPQATDHRS